MPTRIKQISEEIYWMYNPSYYNCTCLIKRGDRVILIDTCMQSDAPGHTPGHISFYNKKSKTLFAGDALAVIKQQIRLMAGVVTPDKSTSITSVLKLIEGRDITIICPGHREPLVKSTSSEIIRFADQIKKMKKWPLLG